MRRPRSSEADRAAAWVDALQPGLRRTSVTVPELPWKREPEQEEPDDERDDDLRPARADGKR